MDVNLNSVTTIPYTNDYVNQILMNPVVIIIVIAIIVIYFAVFASLGVSSGSPGEASSAGGKGLKYIEILIWGLFILLLLLNGMSYFFNFDVTARLSNLFSPEPSIDVLVNNEYNDANDGEMYGIGDGEELPITGTDDVPENMFEKQVYHVPGNNYTYDNAKAICAAYGNRLANIDELQAAYNKGADWCSYGWSDNQMALYPTQTYKWNMLQRIKGHEHDCGRPGINGGYIANPNVQFGINCYGYKPEITAAEANSMANDPIYPVTQKELDFNRRVNYWKTQLNNITVSPFNRDSWNE